MRIRRLGIVRLSAIGDVVHAMPLAMGLRAAFPGASITWIVQRQAAPLLADHPAVDDVLIYPRRGTVLERWRFLRALRRCRLDVTVDPQGNMKSGVIGLLSGAPVRTGLHVKDCKEPGNALFTNRQGRPATRPHGVDRAWACAQPLGVVPGPDTWGLCATEGERENWRGRCFAAGADPDGPLLAMHLADPDDVRSWFEDAWVRTARAAVAAGRQVVLNGQGGGRQSELAAQIRREAGAGVFDLTGKDDLRGVLAQYASMAERDGNALLSTDSGPAHVGAAVGLDVVCLGGPQDPARTGPRVGRAVTAWEGLGCAPCLQRRCIRTPPDRACMRQISVDAVLAALGIGERTKPTSS